MKLPARDSRWSLGVPPLARDAYTHVVLAFAVARKQGAVLLLAASIFVSPVQSATSGNATRQQFLQKLVAAATERAAHSVRYEPAYVVIPYPGGDVPLTTGVCTDEIIRSYSALGIDLQKEVHEDMAADFAAYPRKWHRTRPDSNIDHRRVPNLQVFFSRKGESLPITGSARDYSPGDLVTWDLGGGLTHIGIVVDSKAFFSARNKILHNIGAGPKIEDVLFNWKITGHYRYFGPQTLARNP